MNARSDCSILSLTWMGKVPDELPEVGERLRGWSGLIGSVGFRDCFRAEEDWGVWLWRAND